MDDTTGGAGNRPTPIWRLAVQGLPTPKGSMKCIGQRGPVKHVLVEDDTSGGRARWRETLTAAGRDLAKRMDGPIGTHAAIGALFILPRPAAARNRLLPNRKTTGDLDKLTRQLLDALTDAEVLADDSRVVGLLVFKVYETETRRPGAVVYVTEAANPHYRILAALLDAAPELMELDQ